MSKSIRSGLQNLALQGHIQPVARNRMGTYAGPDHCTEEGARRLAARVVRFWHDRGYTVNVKVRAHGFHERMRSAWYSLESDMVNGLPKDYNVKPKNPNRR